MAPPPPLSKAEPRRRTGLGPRPVSRLLALLEQVGAVRSGRGGSSADAGVEPDQAVRDAVAEAENSDEFSAHVWR